MAITGPAAKELRRDLGSNDEGPIGETSRGLRPGCGEAATVFEVVSYF